MKISALNRKLHRAFGGRVTAALADGCIGPDPRGGDPCGYCPVLACEKRMGA